MSTLADALRGLLEADGSQQRAEAMDVARAALAAHEAGQQEARPVAWRRRSVGRVTRLPEDWRYSDGPAKPAVNSPADCEFEPLYAAAPAQPQEARPVAPEVLIGSSRIPALTKINGEDVQLGELVAAAQAASGLSVEAWNSMSEQARDVLIETEIDGRHIRHAFDIATEEALAEVPGLNAPPSAEQLAMLAEADAKFAADAIDWEQERAAFNAWFEQGDKLPFTPWHAWQARAALAAHEAGQQEALTHVNSPALFGDPDANNLLARIDALLKNRPTSAE